jgi:hypothetical protein
MSACSLTSVFVLGLLMLPLALGCGDGKPTRVPVAGKVLIDGQPLKYGYVKFIPQGARASGGGLDESGRFVLGCFSTDDGAVLGKHRVEVMSQKHLSETTIQWSAPKKYASQSTSGLSYEVTAATENATFNLTWDGGKPYVEVIEGSNSEGNSPY